jgi:hypothetical protein
LVDGDGGFVGFGAGDGAATFAVASASSPANASRYSAQ